MLTWADAQKLLQENNPFSSDASPPPWDNHEPAALNVASINQAAVNRIGGLLNEIKQSPMKPFAGLVRGEAGTGKTHLLKQLLEFTRQKAIDVVFCDIDTLLDPAEPYRHLLRQLLNNLRQKRVLAHPKLLEKTQENWLFVIKEIIARYRGRGGRLALAMWREHFYEYEPRLNDNVLVALFRYISWVRERDSRRVLLTLKWLSGSESPEAAAALGFPDRSALSGQAKEDEALQIIWSLGTLMRYAGLVMLIGFDRLDGMRDPAVIAAFGNQILELVDKSPSVLPLLFMRSQTWSDRFSPALDPAVRQRLESNQIALKNCDLAQARELVERRINAHFAAAKKNLATEIFSAMWNRLQKKINFGYTPRQVIQLANAAVWEEFAGETAETAVAEAKSLPAAANVFAHVYQKTRQKIAETLAQNSPDRAQMFVALEKFLRAGDAFVNVRRESDESAAIGGDYRKAAATFPTKFFINTAEHPLAVLAALNHALLYLTENPESRLVFLCDSRCDFRRKMTWRKTQAALNALKTIANDRADLRFLTPAQTVDYYALAALIGKFDNADISWMGAAGFYAATHEDFTAWLRDDFTGDLGLADLFVKKTAEEKSPPLDAPTADRETVARLVAELKVAPMRTLTGETLAEKLAMDIGDLAMILRQESELINVYETRGGLTAQLRKNESENQWRRF